MITEFHSLHRLPESQQNELGIFIPVPFETLALPWNEGGGILLLNPVPTFPPCSRFHLLLAET